MAGEASGFDLRHVPADHHQGLIDVAAMRWHILSLERASLAPFLSKQAHERSARGLRCRLRARDRLTVRT
jgi:hypothetical protein